VKTACSCLFQDGLSQIDETHFLLLYVIIIAYQRTCWITSSLVGILAYISTTIKPKQYKELLQNHCLEHFTAIITCQSATKHWILPQASHLFRCPFNTISNTKWLCFCKKIQQDNVLDIYQYFQYYCWNSFYCCLFLSWALFPVIA